LSERRERNFRHRSGDRLDRREGWLGLCNLRRRQGRDDGWSIRLARRFGGEGGLRFREGLAEGDLDAVLRRRLGWRTGSPANRISRTRTIVWTAIDRVSGTRIPLSAIYFNKETASLEEVDTRSMQPTTSPVASRQ
jgi:hypothetical protein